MFIYSDRMAFTKLCCTRHAREKRWSLSTSSHIQRLWSSGLTGSVPGTSVDKRMYRYRMRLKPELSLNFKSQSAVAGLLHNKKRHQCLAHHALASGYIPIYKVWLWDTRFVAEIKFSTSRLLAFVIHWVFKRGRYFSRIDCFGSCQLLFHNHTGIFECIWLFSISLFIYTDMEHHINWTPFL